MTAGVVHDVDASKTRLDESADFAIDHDGNMVSVDETLLVLGHAVAAF
jgi:hypothetical protein